MALNTKFVALVSFVIMYAAAAAIQTKRITSSDIIVDYLAPPVTLEDAVNGAAAIVIATVSEERTLQPTINGADPRLVYTVTVSQVLRPHRNLTLPQFDLYRFGADVDAGDRIVRKLEIGFPRFLPHHEYLMFLSWNRVLNAFEPGYGPNGIFELLPNGNIETPGRASFAQLQRMKAGATLIDDVKRALARP